jgi:hypothetical protein
MISRNILTDILFIVVLVILQVFLLNRILIMSKYPPILYPIYVMFYPFYRDKFQFLGTSFLLGLGMDMFLGTWGINAFATTLIAFVRTVIFRSSSDSTSDFFSFESLQWTQFLGFILTNLFLHQFLVQFIEYFKLSRALDVLINISITTAYSFVFVLFYVLIFKIKQRV